MKQSEVWLIDLDPTKGAEIQKKRPAIIVNDNKVVDNWEVVARKRKITI